MSEIVNGGRNPVCLKDREALSLASVEARESERSSPRGWKDVQLKDLPSVGHQLAQVGLWINNRD